MPPIASDPWLSDRFGYDVYRVVPTPDATSLLVEHRASIPRAFYYVKIPVTATSDIAAFSEAAFRVVETHIAFRADPHEVEPRSVAVADGVTVGDLPDLHEDAMAIAATCFRYSRFHLDPFVPDALAHAIKREWVRSYTRRERGDRLFIAARGGRAIGFLAALRADVHGEPCAVIDLMGVHPDAQGIGVGSLLIRSFADAYRGTVAALHVGTQAANIPSVRCYERMGFRLASAAYILHLHHQQAAVPIATRA
ncbi:MAG: GNAT family N-acetyltransferase [bacterium]|nr:GNAT family N-acetyltransferase [bacterium]